MVLMEETYLDENAIEYPKDYDPSLNGINGLLILIISSEIYSIIFSIVMVCRIFSYIGNNSLITIVVIIQIFLSVVLPLVILLLLFFRKILFRLFFVIQTAAYFIFTFSLYYGHNFFNLYDLISFIPGSVIWIIYLYKSKRVKNTFVYPKLFKQK